MGSDSLIFVKPRDLFMERVMAVKGEYPEPFPGNIAPTRKPKFAMLVLYEIMRGKGLNNSFKRMVKMMYDVDEVEKVVNKFVEYQNNNPDVSGYLNLAKAYADTHGIKYDYSTAEFGNVLRVWGKNKEEWTFEIRRGEHMIRGGQTRDYSKMLRVDRIDMLSFNEVGKIRKDLIKPFGKKK